MKGHNYGLDVGNLHVIDYYLHCEAQLHAQVVKKWNDCANAFANMLEADRQILRFDPSDWTRYD